MMMTLTRRDLLRRTGLVSGSALLVSAWLAPLSLVAGQMVVLTVRISFSSP